MNTTPIEQCSLSADAEYTIKAATERGWSRFVIFPSGALLGTSPDGVEDEPVPNYAQMLKDAAPELLAALEAGYNDLRTRLIQYAQSAFGASYEDAVKYTDTGVPVLAQMRAAIAKAKGETK